MLFGSKNAPATFQRSMDISLEPVKWQHALVYSDKVVIFLKTLEEHVNHVKSVEQLTDKEKMTLNLKKHFCFTNAVDCYGHVLMSKRSHVATKTKHAVSNLKYSMTTSELRSLPAQCNVHRRFIPNVSQTAAFRKRQLKNGEPDTLELNDDKRQTIKDLRWKIRTTQVLALQTPERQFIIKTDTCDKQVGCVLPQEHEEGYIRSVAC